MLGIGKAICSYFVVSFSGCLCIFVSKPDLFGVHRYVELYTISEEIKTIPTEDINIKNDHNFECHFEDDVKKKFECSIFQPIIHPSKRHWNVDGLIDTQEEIDKKILAVKDNIFKLKITKDVWNDKKGLTKKIHVVLKNKKSTDTDITYAKLKPLFGLYANQKLGNTKFFVGKALEVQDTNDAGDSKLCDLVEPKENIVDAMNTYTATTDCRIFQFDKNEQATKNGNYELLTFRKTDTEAKQINKNKHYLVEFVGTEKKLDEIGQFKWIFSKSKTLNKNMKLIFKDIQPTVYDGVKNIFIF